MNFHEIFTGLSSRSNTQLISIGIGILGLILIGYGLIAFLGFSQPRDAVVFESSSSDLNSTSDSSMSAREKSGIVVDVEGSVVKPGVYHVDQAARVLQALVSAGGLSEEADRDWVAKHVNLAARLSDGSKIYIPRIGEAMGTTGSNGITNTTGILGGKDSSININTASLDELDSLRGVGKATAQKIIDGRPYQSVDELLTKKIVSKRVFEQSKDTIVAN